MKIAPKRVNCHCARWFLNRQPAAPDSRLFLGFQDSRLAVFTEQNVCSAIRTTARPAFRCLPDRSAFAKSSLAAFAFCRHPERTRRFCCASFTFCRHADRSAAKRRHLSLFHATSATLHSLQRRKAPAARGAFPASIPPTAISASDHRFTCPSDALTTTLQSNSARASDVAGPSLGASQGTARDSSRLEIIAWCSQP